MTTAVSRDRVASGDNGEEIGMTDVRVASVDTLAPWAEIVPHRGCTTVDDLLALPDDGWRYEVVEGVLVRMAGSSFDATTIAFNLGADLRAFARPRRLGVVTGADGVYTFPSAETRLLPDVGFVEAAKVSAIDRAKPISFAPDLAIEVVSPSQRLGSDEMAAKARQYLQGGTRLVWVIWPERREIDVWHAVSIDRPTTTLHVDDALDGEDIAPDFMYPVADIFADPLGQPAN